MTECAATSVRPVPTYDGDRADSDRCPQRTQGTVAIDHIQVCAGWFARIGVAEKWRLAGRSATIPL